MTRPYDGMLEVQLEANRLRYVDDGDWPRFYGRLTELLERGAQPPPPLPSFSKPAGWELR